MSHKLVKYYRDFGQSVRWLAADVPPNYRQFQTGDVPIKAWNIVEERFGFPSPIPHPHVIPILVRNIQWCDIVHLQDCLYPINILAFIILKLLKKPVLITQYAKPIPYKQPYKRILQTIGYTTIGRIMFKAADRLVFITSNVRDSMLHINPNKQYDVVPLGVDADFFAPLPTQKRNEIRKQITGDLETPILLFVGRMVERKGIHLLESLVKECKKWHWLLIGRPDDYDPAAWNAPNLTYFKSVTENQLREAYAAADLLIHPSQGEGFTLIASEGMACGTPVVISKESLYEIDKKYHKLFFPVNPETSEIFDMISNALNDRSHLNALRTQVRAFVINRLSWKKVSLEYLSILRQLRDK